MGKVPRLRKLEKRLLDVEEQLRILQEQWQLLRRESDPYIKTLAREIRPEREGIPKTKNIEASEPGRGKSKILPMLPGYPTADVPNGIGIPNRTPE